MSDTNNSKSDLIGLRVLHLILERASMCVIHSAQIVASSVKLGAESDGPPELCNRLLNQEDAL